METVIFKDAVAPSPGLIAAVNALAQTNIPPDIQALLLDGDPDRHIAPRALQKAIVAAARELRIGK